MEEATTAQLKLLHLLAQHDLGDGAEYWPLINDWIGDRKLHIGHVNRTVQSMIYKQLISIDDDGYVRMLPNGKSELASVAFFWNGVAQRKPKR